MKKKDETDFFEIPKDTLSFRRSIGYSSYGLMLFFLVSVSLLVASLVGFFQVRNADPKMAMSLIVNAGFFGMFSALFFALWKFNFHPLIKAKIKLFESSLLFSDSMREYSIYFEDLDRVEYVSFLGFSRLVLKTKDHDVFSYSMWITNVEKILDSIYAYDSKLIGEAKYEEVRKQMILSGHNFARLELFLTGKMLWITIAHTLLIPGLFFTGMLWKQSSINVFSRLDYFISSLQPFLFVVTILSGFYFIATNMLITRYMLLKNKDKIDSGFRDSAGELFYHKKAYPFYAGMLALLLSLIVALDINFYSVMMVSKSSVPLNLLKGDKVWVDKRFNCVSCKYRLQKDDVIVFVSNDKRKRVFGKVVELHPEFSRIPASVENKSKAFLVHSSESEQSEYISFEQVIGKKL